VCTGALTSFNDHPAQKFLAAGVPCSLNTDDRTLFGLDLTSELNLALTGLDLTSEQVQNMQDAAWQAVFSE